MAMSLTGSSAPGVADSRAPSPRPRPRLFMSDHLTGQVEIRQRAARFELVQHDRLAMARSFAEPDVAWNDGLEDLSRKVALDLIADLQRKTRASIEHREHDPLDREPRIQALAHELHGLQKMRQALERVELALQRYEHTIRGR